jgi:hypothetical protein
MRARDAIRSLIQQLSLDVPDLPTWATTSITNEDIDLVNAYAAADTWPEQQATLNAYKELFVSPDFRAALCALADLYPVNPIPGRLLALLDEINEDGMESTFARHLDNHDRRALLNAWISTTTWTESQQFLSAHREALLDDQTIDLLTHSDDATARQHLAILQLTTAMPDDQVYALVVDSSQSETAALDAIESGDLALLSAILTAAPSLSDRPGTWSIAVAVLLLAQNEQDQARELTRAAAEQATPLQRRAQVIRLRALHAKQPDLPGLVDLIEIMQPPTTT